MSTIFWSENLRGRDYLEDVDRDVKVVSECILERQGKKVCGSL